MIGTLGTFQIFVHEKFNKMDLEIKDLKRKVADGDQYSKLKEKSVQQSFARDNKSSNFGSIKRNSE